MLLHIASTPVPEQILHLITIFLLYIVTWVKIVRGSWLIDDDEGLAKFSERWDVAGDKLVNGYKEGDKEHRFLAYLPHLGFPGAFMRWHRLHLGKKYQVVGKNKKGHEVYGFVQSAFRHHVWSLLWYGLALLLCYSFLNFHFGSSVAFGATLLFAVHPIISQCVAWISGINYIYCLTFLLANYNILQLGLSYYWTIPLTLLLTALSSLSLLVGCFNFAVLWTLGFHWEAFAALCVGVLVMLRDGLGVVNYRRGEFKKQNMTNSITPNIRKPIVMLKTLWYYLCLIVLPKNLGLYHIWGYHYSRKDEEPDFKFWAGLLSFIGMLAAFWTGGLIVKLAVVWFLAYFAVFSNFLTANQFVVERYVFIPSLAFCILFGWLVYPYQPLFWLLIGLYAMRSICHVWTFKDQVSFYTSNIQNFPLSEVAHGNLGVAYQNQGKSGTAYDLWMEATKINPHYDVPWYNMHSLVKTAGQLEQSREFLKKCMDAKVVHFEEHWKREMVELDKAIMKKQCYEAVNAELSAAINAGKLELIPELKKKMDIIAQPGTVVEIAPPKASS